MNEETGSASLEFPDTLKSVTVLFVEDDEDVRELLSRFLTRRVGALHLAANGREGLEMFTAIRPDIVITDIRMPLMNGLEMAEAIKHLSPETPIIITTAFSERDYLMQAIKIGVDCFVTKPVNTEALVQAIERCANTAVQRREREQSNKSLFDALTKTIAVLSRAVEMRDPFTNGHQKRVSELAVAIATEMGLPASRILGIKFGALIHDVGKMAIPAEMLITSRRLTDAEMAIVRTHPAVGSRIVREAEFPWPVADMILQHHERLDGSGYPANLKNGEILLEAKIIGVADVVEAMASHRPYRPACGMDTAMQEIRDKRGVLYDPQVVDACLRVIERTGGKFWEPAHQKAGAEVRQ